MFRLERCEEAIEDVHYALRVNPESFKAVIAYGNALYGLGQFEKGLVVFQRGWVRRKDSKMRLGIQKCMTAIEDAIGRHAKQFDVELVKQVINEMEREKEAIPARVMTESAKLREAYKSKKKKEKERLRKEKMKKKVDKILLGRVADDCSYLRVLAGVDTEQDETEVSEYQVKY